MTTEPPLTAASEKSGRIEDDGKSVKSAGDGEGVGSLAMSGKSVKSQKSTGGGLGIGVPSPITSAHDNPSADLRNMRRIIAEDQDWSLATVPLLVELCIKHIVDNFESKSQAIRESLSR